MSYTITITGTPTLITSGGVYTAHIEFAVPSDNEDIRTTQLVQMWLYAPLFSGFSLSGYQPCNLLRLDTNDAADFIHWFASVPPHHPYQVTGNVNQNLTGFNGGAYIQLTRAPANGKSFTFTATWQVLNTVYGSIIPTQAQVLLQTEGTTTTNAPNCTVQYPQGSSGTPNAPTGLTVTAHTESSVSLGWTDTNIGELGTTIFLSTDDISFSPIGNVGQSAVAYTAVGLSPSTAYHFKVAAFNQRGLSAFSNEVDATTDAPPPAPTTLVTAISATEVSANEIDISWTADTTNDETGWIISRGDTTGGPYTEIARVPNASPSFNYVYADKTCSPSSTYFYVITAFNAGGTGTQSAEASAETAAQIVTLATDLGFTFMPGANTKIIQAAGRCEFWSDLDRPVVRINRRTYKMGLKPQIVAPDVALNGSGTLSGTFNAFIMLLRSDGLTPSMPSPASADITVTNGCIKITPEVDPNDATKIHVRDIGYNTDGTQIPGCDFYEVYLFDKNGARGKPVLLDTLAITQLYYTTPSDLTTTALDDPSRKEMDLNFSNLLPPAARDADYNPAINRVVCFGERTLRPSDAETANGATLTINNGDRFCTVSSEWENVDLDALYHKQLYINKAETGWFVVDVDNRTLTIRNPDQKKDDNGFAGGSGTYADFAFASPSRVSESAYYSAGIGVPAQFQPETFPPRYIESQLNPDDNQDPNGIIASKDVMFFTKLGSCFLAQGGAATDEDDSNGDNLPTISNVSRGSGLLARKTLCRDRFDVVYGLNDQGPFSLRQSGVQKIGTLAGVAWLLQKYYDVNSAAGAVGAWFIREDYFICCGINRRGNFGSRDWFIYDSRNNAVMMQDFPRRITALEQSPTDGGDYQMLYGDESGNLGVLLTPDVYVDGTNYQLSDPTSQEIPLAVEIVSGQIVPQYGFSPSLMRPHIKIDGQSADLPITVEYQDMKRSGEADGFTASKSTTLTLKADRNPDNKQLPRKQCQGAKFRLAFNAPRNSQVRIGSNIEVEAVEASAG